MRGIAIEVISESAVKVVIVGTLGFNLWFTKNRLRAVNKKDIISPKAIPSIAAPQAYSSPIGTKVSAKT